MKGTRELDPHPIRDAWFLSDDGTEAGVIESYLDADALVEHAHHIAEARNALFRDFAEEHTVVFYAEPSPALDEAVNAMPPGAVTIKRFSFFQGLYAGIEVTEEVPA